MTEAAARTAGHRRLVHDGRRARRWSHRGVRRAGRCSSRRPRGSAATRRAPGEEFEATELSRRGTVWSYTDAQYQPPPPYIPATDPYVPFALAAVELPEGIVVLGQLADGYGVDDVRVGSEVEVVVETLYTDDSGERTIWRWKPVRRARRGGRPVSHDVAVLGVGMHPWGKWGRNFVSYGVHAAREALADSDVSWEDVDLVVGGETVRNGYARLRRRRDLRAGARLERRPRRHVVRRLRHRRPGARHRPRADPRGD